MFCWITLFVPSFMASVEEARLSASRGVFFENSPLKPGIDGDRIKTFQEFLDLSLKNSDLNDESIQEVTVPKKPFLRKGTGLARFNPPVKERRQYRDTNNNPEENRRNNVRQNLFNNKNDVIEILPRTCTRISTQIRDVAVVRKDGQSSKPLAKKPPSKTRSVEQSSSLENLERLLNTVRDRKQEVLQHLQEEIVVDDEDTSSGWESEDSEE